MDDAVGKRRFAEMPLPINKLWFLLDDNARCKIIEKVISGTPCGQNIQQFIRFFDPDASHHTNATRKHS